MRRWLATLCGAAVLSASPLSLAETAAESEEEVHDVREIGVLDQATLDRTEVLFFSGLEHYRKGRFEEAVVAFQEAYTLTRHRDLLYNVARSREQLGDKAGAVEWYRAYLATTPADETAIIHRVRQLGGEPSPAKPADVANTLSKAAPVEVIESGPGPLPWVALGTGIAAAAVGTTFGLMALDDASKARSAERRAPALAFKDDAETKALIADVSFAVAAVGLGAAVWLWLDAEPETPAAGQVQVGASATGASIGWVGRF